MTRYRVLRLVAAMVVCALCLGVAHGRALASSVGKVSLLAYDGPLPTSSPLTHPDGLAVGDRFAVWVVASQVVALQGLDLRIEYSTGVLDVEEHEYTDPATGDSGVRSRIVPGEIKDVAVDLGSVDRGRGLVSYVAANMLPSGDTETEMVLLKIGFAIVGQGPAYVRFATDSPQLATAGVSCSAKAVEELAFSIGHQPTIEPLVEALVVSADRGGTVRNQGDGIVMTVPPGALADDVEISLRATNVSVAVTAGYEVIGIWEVGLQSRVTGQSVEAFYDHCTIRFTVDLANVSAERREQLRLYYWSAAVSAWVEIPSSFDQATSSFVASLPHASVFAVMADTSTTEVPATVNAPAVSLGGSKWLANGSGPAGDPLRLVVNGVVQATARVDDVGRWQAWVTLKEGCNWVFAATDKASSEAYPVYCPLLLIDTFGHWAEQYISDLVEANIITGYEDRTFRMEDGITRAEFCAFVVRTLGLQPDPADGGGFIDWAEVPAWARPYVGAAAQEGIITGHEDGSLRADTSITRAQMAVMVWRSIKLLDVSAPSFASVAFSDSDSFALWAKEGIQKASDYGIIVGYSDGSFGPDRPATRAEAATMLTRLFRLRWPE